MALIVRRKIVINYLLKSSGSSPAARLCSTGLVVLALLPGCTSVGPDFRTPATALQSSWDFDEAANPSSDESAVRESPITFWEGFRSPALLRLLQRAVENSPTLASAREQVSQAQAQLRVTQGSSRPAVSISASETYSQPDIGSRLKGKNEGSTTSQLLGQLSWEIDFWGKQRRAVEADRASLNGAEAALGAARVSLQASVASTYCNVRLLQQRIAVAEANLAQQAENMRIAEARYRFGATSELDWRQAQTQFEQTSSQLPSLRGALAQYQHALSVLVGETPNFVARAYPAPPSRFVTTFAAASSVVEEGLPDLPETLPLGTPRDLLRRRPDVRQAALAAAAQSAKIGQAEAALYPSFSLTGSLGASTTNGIDDLFRWDNRALSRGFGFYFPIFDRGQLVAQIEVRDSQFKQAVLAYQNQVLKAQQEVADALTAIDQGRAQIISLKRADQAAAQSAVLALARYRAGQTDYTTVSSAEQSRLQASDALVQARGALLESYISAYRAVGGGWAQSSTANNGSTAK